MVPRIELECLVVLRGIRELELRRSNRAPLPLRRATSGDLDRDVLTTLGDLTGDGDLSLRCASSRSVDFDRCLLPFRASRGSEWLRIGFTCRAVLTTSGERERRRCSSKRGSLLSFGVSVLLIFSRFGDLDRPLLSRLSARGDVMMTSTCRGELGEVLRRGLGRDSGFPFVSIVTCFWFFFFRLSFTVSLTSKSLTLS